MAGIRNNLYPPIFKKSFAPAFLKENECKIIFTLSVYNSINEINTNLVQVVVQNQKTNQNVLKKAIYPSGIKITTMEKNGENGEYSISIKDNDIQDGFQYNEFYKVQIRFTSTSNEISQIPTNSQNLDNWLNNNFEFFSEWSSVLLIKPISNIVYTSRYFDLDENTTTILTSNNIVIAGVLRQ